MPSLSTWWRRLRGSRLAPGVDARTLGALGEDAAVKRLKRMGYIILDRNVTTRHGEVDILARDADVLCFVEVKTRRSAAFGRPVEAVTPAKQKQIARAAREILHRRRLSDSPCRFDVVAVSVGPDGEAEVEVLQGAFCIDARG